MVPTLLLNADARPVNLLPLSAIGWQKAIAYQCGGVAEPLHLYEEWDVHSPSTSLKVPAVMILKEQITYRPHVRGVPSSWLVFLRDDFTCQYCNERFGRTSLTLDHVRPRTFGGRSTWENLASACGKCNSRRGHDESIRPRRMPWHPTQAELVRNLRRYPLTVPHPTWNYYLGWPVEKLKIVPPCRTSLDATE